MSLRVDYDERAISQAAAFLDDPQGMRAVLDAIDQPIKIRNENHANRA